MVKKKSVFIAVLLGAVIVVGMVFITFLKGESVEKFEQISSNTEVKTVVEMVGEPDKKITSKIEIDKLFNEDLKLFNLALNKGELEKYVKFYGTNDSNKMIEKLQVINNQTNKLVIYQYKAKNNRGKLITKNIYFFENKVFFQELN